MPRDALTAFFSYSRDDSEFALRLAEDLKAAGADVWLDQLDIAPGQRWARAVQDALQNSPRVLVILSPASVNSTHVEDEVTFALDEQKTVIPVFYQDCKVPLRLRPLQYVDFRTDYARGLKVMLKTLDVKQLSAASLAEAPTSPRASPPIPADAEEGGHVAEAQLGEERKQDAERARLGEEQRQGAAEKVRLEEQKRRTQAAAEKARLEQQERERQSAGEKAHLEHEERQRQGAVHSTATPIAEHSGGISRPRRVAQRAKAERAAQDRDEEEPNAREKSRFGFWVLISIVLFGAAGSSFVLLRNKGSSKQENPPDLIAEYRERIRRNPEDDSTRRKLGQTLEEKGDVDGAIAVYRDGARFDPSDKYMHKNLADALSKKGDLEAAIAEFREEIRLAPTGGTSRRWVGLDYPWLHEDLGKALEKKGELKDALEQYSVAAKLDPNNPGHRDAYARVSAELKTQGEKFQGRVLSLAEQPATNWADEADFHVPDPANPVVRDFVDVTTPGGLGVRLTSSSNPRGRGCGCARKRKLFTLPVVMNTDNTRLQGWFEARRGPNDPFSLTSLQVDLLHSHAVVSTRVYAAEHRPNNNCIATPGTESLLTNTAPFDIKLSTIVPNTDFDAIQVHLNAYSCGTSVINSIAVLDLQLVYQ